jgi:5-bromo-4-chloroindolyl phosphate hydrolysis protein
VKKDNGVYVIIALALSLAVFAASMLILQWTVVTAALLSLGSYAGLTLLFTPVFHLAGINMGDLKNGKEIMDLLEEGERDLASIKKIIDVSGDPQIRAGAQNVYREGGKIIGYVKRNPSKGLMARRFFNYYLDKADEILKKYHNVTSAEIETDRLSSLKEKTLSALDSIFKGMDLQFSKLISSEVIDIEADIKLLESTIRMEDS